MMMMMMSMYMYMHGQLWSDLRFQRSSNCSAVCHVLGLV